MSRFKYVINCIVELNKSAFLSGLCLYLLGMPTMLQAQKFDQAYLKWKAEQQAQDIQLKKVDDNYYLSRPTIQPTQTHLAGKGRASSTQVQSNLSPKINLNSANVAQLQQLNGVGAKKAQAIIDHRQQYGKFKNVEDIKNVKGIGPSLYEKNKNQLGL
ncbi:ComEA family DNA-binding protein [Acinetobacter nematophilus]|uniref:ComEA family DNA-binding protein n=1 Tax=Acinetobacter nematophilus TaxID=2994642 RepID=A0A9X3DSU5_9GAMM|nr:ComEA family DNA-binding protein [Acinetobacter nematophilus]MCX5467869.1 ComEA family DNA-binding protein [Acinetobacter nematophilus]